MSEHPLNLRERRARFQQSRRELPLQSWNCRSVIFALRRVARNATIDERAEKIASVIDEFWSALKQQMPELFDAPNDYTLFKSGSIGPMHLVLRDLLIKMHRGHRKFVKHEFAVVIAGSELLTNADFWRSENDEGAADLLRKGELDRPRQAHQPRHRRECRRLAPTSGACTFRAGACPPRRAWS